MRQPPAMAVPFRATAYAYMRWFFHAYLIALMMVISTLMAVNVIMIIS